MGGVKALMIERMERGYDAVAGDICSHCVNDDWLKQWVDQNATAKRCTFCGRRSKKAIAVSFEEFVPIIMSAIGFGWNHPANEGIAYETAEGGYQAGISDLSDVLWDIDVSDNEAVTDALSDSIDDDGWVEREYYRGTERDILRWGWDSFKKLVKHETRYFFTQPADEELYMGAEIHPSAMLDAISDVIVNRLKDSPLIRTIPTDVDLIRIRMDTGRRHHTASAIGTPPAQYALQSNRMSPVGVPMFYGAFDYKTALAETFDPAKQRGETASIGIFRAIRELRVLDLASLPDIPSIYDEDRRHLIHPLAFLHDFTEDMAQPIRRGAGLEHIEYVPTQIVTEYFRRVFKVNGERLDGICYRSSKPGAGNAFVLYCENEQCIDDEPKRFFKPMLRLIKVRHKKP
jgi:Zn ribbon nucleic-acid-binding protein